MTYFKVKENTKQGKVLSEFLKSLPFVEQIEEDQIPNRETIKAMKEAKSGKVNKYRSSAELFEKIRNKSNV